MAAALRPVPHRLCCRFSEIWRDPHQESKTLMWDHTPRKPVWDWKRVDETPLRFHKCILLLLVDLLWVLWGPSRHLGSLTVANWVSFDFNV